MILAKAAASQWWTKWHGWGVNASSAASSDCVGVRRRLYSTGCLRLRFLMCGLNGRFTLVWNSKKYTGWVMHFWSLELFVMVVGCLLWFESEKCLLYWLALFLQAVAVGRRLAAVNDGGGQCVQIALCGQLLAWRSILINRRRRQIILKVYTRLGGRISGWVVMGGGTGWLQRYKLCFPVVLVVFGLIPTWNVVLNSVCM